MIRHKSTSHYILLMLKSANGRPKTRMELQQISGRTLFKVDRTVEVLMRHGLATEVEGERFPTYQITQKGIDTVYKLTRNGNRQMQSDDNIVAKYEQTKARQAERQAARKAASR